MTSNPTTRVDAGRSMPVVPCGREMNAALRAVHERCSPLRPPARRHRRRRARGFLGTAAGCLLGCAQVLSMTLMLVASASPEIVDAAVVAGDES